MSVSTTTRPIYNSTCVNQTWSSSTNRLAEWLFDGSLVDEMNNYNITSRNNISFTTNGYNRQAIIFGSNTNSTLISSYIPLSSVSFTVDMWIYITGISNKTSSIIFGLCSQMIIGQCLNLAIRRSTLYMSFFSDDCSGITLVTLNTWIHAAFVFDLST